MKLALLLSITYLNKHHRTFPSLTYFFGCGWENNKFFYMQFA